MRILHTSDWHLGRRLEGYSRLDEQVAVLDEMVDIARQANVHLVLVAGDVFDTYHPPAQAEGLFYETLERLCDGGRRAVAVIAGNHDHPDRLCAASPLAYHRGIALAGRPGEVHIPLAQDADPTRVRWTQKSPGVLQVQIPATQETAVVAVLPYPSESRLQELWTDVSLDESVQQQAYSQRVASFFRRAQRDFGPHTVNLAVSHLFVLGGTESESERPIQLGGAYAVHPQALPAQAHYVALGHLHRPQVVAGVPHARYSGSPLAYSFSEAGQSKAVFVVDVDPSSSRVTVEEVPLERGRPLALWRANGYAEALRWAEGGRDMGCWIDLEIQLEEPLTFSQIQELKQVRPDILRLRPILPQVHQTGYVRREGVPVEELFRQFYRRQRGHWPSEETLRLFSELVHAMPPETMDVE